MLTDFLRLCVEVLPATAEFVLVLGRPCLDLLPLDVAGLPGFEWLDLNLNSVGLGRERFPVGGEPFLFLPDALLALVQLRLDRSNRRLAFVDPARFLDQLALAGLDPPDPRVELRAEGLGLSCEIIDGLPVLRDLELAALQVFFLRIDRRPVARKLPPFLLYLLVTPITFAGSTLDPDPPR